jgi:hypothetical protein
LGVETSIERFALLTPLRDIPLLLANLTHCHGKAAGRVIVVQAAPDAERTLELVAI